MDILTELQTVTFDPTFIVALFSAIGNIVLSVLYFLTGKRIKATEQVLTTVANINGYTDYRTFLVENARDLCPNCNSAEDTNKAVDTLVRSLGRLKK